MSGVHACVLMLEDHGETVETFCKCFLYYMNISGWIAQKENFCHKNYSEPGTAEVNYRIGENIE